MQSVKLMNPRLWALVLSHIRKIEVKLPTEVTVCGCIFTPQVQNRKRVAGERFFVRRHVKDFVYLELHESLLISAGEWRVAERVPLKILPAARTPPAVRTMAMVRSSSASIPYVCRLLL
jgi:hypothetical protein